MTTCAPPRLHARVAMDAAPARGGAARRALTAVRATCDAAPAAAAAHAAVTPVAGLLPGLFRDLDLLLLSVEGRIEARGPPEAVTR